MLSSTNSAAGNHIRVELGFPDSDLCIHQLTVFADFQEFSAHKGNAAMAEWMTSGHKGRDLKTELDVLQLQ
jgi:hypothetical protein